MAHRQTIAELLQMQRKSALWECKKGEQGQYEYISYTHQGYGIIEPVLMEGIQRYRRGMCPCEREAQAKNRAQKEALACARQQDALRRETFGWLGKSWADAALDAKTYANFDISRQREAVDAVRNFQEIRRGTLILYGSYGTGKTHLLAALCNDLHKSNVSCLFASSAKLFSAIQDLIGRNESYVPLLSRAMHTPLLILDDIDKAKPSDFRQEIYFAIVDERTRRELPIAISTNRLAELESFVGGAVYSRLKIGQVAIQMAGGDYREEL